MPSLHVGLHQWASHFKHCHHCPLLAPRRVGKGLWPVVFLLVVAVCLLVYTLISDRLFVWDSTLPRVLPVLVHQRTRNPPDPSNSEHGRDEDQQTEDDDPLDTSPHQSSAREKLRAAVAALRTVNIPPTFKFSSADYFHPPPSNTHIAFPRLLLTPGPLCCGQGQPSKDMARPLLVLLVMSSYLSKAGQERQAIRSTYGSVVKGRQWPGGKPMTGTVHMVFVLGVPPSPAEEQRVRSEGEEWGDMLVADFVDSYHNLTLKVLTALHWALHHSPLADYVMKADDDVFIHLPLLTAFLDERGVNRSLYGTAYLAPFVARAGRWAVSTALYPFPAYPVYLSGTAYVMSVDAARTLVRASGQLPLLPVEDAFITGLLPQLTGLRRVRCSGFTHFTEGRPHLCDFARDTRLVGHRVYAQDKLDLWTALKIHDHRLC